MKFARFFSRVWLALMLAPWLFGQDDTATNNMAAQQATTTAAAAAVANNRTPVHAPNFLNHLVDAVLALFNVPNSGNTPTHFVVSALFLVGAFLLRRVVTLVLFGFLRKLASRTKTTLDDKLFPALETPVSFLIVVTGAVCALKALKLTPDTDQLVNYASTVAFSLVLFWLLLRAFNTVLNHLHEVALEKQMGVAAFMPWIKKTLVAVFVIFGVLMIAQSLGADVKAFLAGLGIGGLAFALAAQDTLANLFGSLVVAVDQPFRLGDVVQIGSFSGSVEDIGLRSTKLRTSARTLIAIPNKTVASEAITNLSRMPQRRIDQMLGLTYDTTAEAMEAILEDLRKILREDSGVAKDSSTVNFVNYGDSSLDIQVVYFAADPDFKRHLELRERINLKFMRAVQARGLSFAFPTRTLQLDGPLARQLVERRPAT